jgi:hypothetical protein
MPGTKSTHLNRIAMRSAGIAGLALLAGSMAFPTSASAISGTSNWNESDWTEQDWQDDQHLQPDSAWFKEYQGHWGLDAQLSVRPESSDKNLSADTEQGKIALASGERADFQFTITNSGERPVFNVKVEDSLGLGSCLDDKLKANEYVGQENSHGEHTAFSVTVLWPGKSYTCEITGKTPAEGPSNFTAKVTGTRGVFWTSQVEDSDSAFVEVAKAVTPEPVIPPVAAVTETPVVLAAEEVAAEAPVVEAQPSEGEELPHTGGREGLFAGIGTALLLAGATAVGAARRHGLN